MTCEMCTDPDGEECLPIYGMGPHRHRPGPMIGSSEWLPRAEWPDNFVEDPDCPGFGTWYCPQCRDGLPPLAPTAGTPGAEGRG